MGLGGPGRSGGRGGARPSHPLLVCFGDDAVEKEPAQQPGQHVGAVGEQKVDSRLEVGCDIRLPALDTTDHGPGDLVGGQRFDRSLDPVGLQRFVPHRGGEAIGEDGFFLQVTVVTRDG